MIAQWLYGLCSDLFLKNYILGIRNTVIISMLGTEFITEHSLIDCQTKNENVLISNVASDVEEALGKKTACLLIITHLDSLHKLSRGVG